MKKCILAGLVGLSLSGIALADKPEDIAHDLSFVTVPAIQAIDRKLRQTRHFNGGKDSKKTLKMLALAHYES